MPIHDSESVKLTFDHIKSVWTLSAGGLAAALGLFAYIVKEARFPLTVNFLFGSGCLMAVLLFIYSIWKGVIGQRDLINEVAQSETSLSPAPKLSDPLMCLIRCGRLMFFWGCFFIAATALAFLSASALWEQSKTSPTVSLKNATLLTKDSKTIAIEDQDFRIPDSTFSLNSDKPIEIRALTLREKAIDEKR